MPQRAMIPMERLPGYGRWGASIVALVALDAPLWIYGAPGSGVSAMAAVLAEMRGEALLDDAERREGVVIDEWLRMHPRGVLGSHSAPGEDCVAPIAARCVAFRVASLEEDATSVSGCFEILAADEGIASPLPSALAQLPCAGNLLGLRNRLRRWKLLGQLPDEEPVGGGALPLEAEDIATNLHVLERLLLHRALRRSYGNRVEAAQRLGVSRRQLYLLVARHGDPVRGESPVNAGPKRFKKQQGRQNSSLGKDRR
jgi:hypothetical protein